ncbi:MAG: hypothetical protein AAF141_01530 [Pseudomonadota bacterium]
MPSDDMYCPQVETMRSNIGSEEAEKLASTGGVTARVDAPSN